MYSNFFCGFRCRILAINQGYTYSNILDLSRKISAMSIADFLRVKEQRRRKPGIQTENNQVLEEWGGIGEEPGKVTAGADRCR